jgi:isopentenyl diphosphate isomerase/L-lactate dehydrogenase-like FMN-dependent dehydrogenase
MSKQPDASATHRAFSRRRLLRFLAASPLLAEIGPALEALGQDGGKRDLIQAPDEALNVMDFEPVARERLPPAHFGLVATGVDDDATVRANRNGFSRFSLRVRRLVDVREIDTSVSLFGGSWDSPIVLAPVSSQRAYHPEGEVAVARAARSRKHLQILSTGSSIAVEEVAAAREAPVWFQLYPTDQWPVTRALIERAAAAGCPALVFTVDLQGGTNRETLVRARRRDPRDCSTCHEGDPLRGFISGLRHKPMFHGLDVSRVERLSPLEMTWDYLDRVRDLWGRKLVVKGIVTREDAQLAVEHRADGIVVSNHGGRAEESGRSTIESLSEVVEGASGSVPVLVDGGFRRGTDIFKALALGAAAVCIGRPYVWGLAGFGQPGVETVLDILRRELVTVMRQAGTRRLGEIQRSHVVDRSSA